MRLPPDTISADPLGGPDTVGNVTPFDALTIVLDAAEARLEAMREDHAEGWREDPTESDALEQAITEVDRWLSSAAAPSSPAG